MNLLSPDFGVFFWQLVTTFLVLLVLKVFVFKLMIKYLEERKEKIDSSLSNSIEIAEKLKNIESLKHNCEIEMSQMREKCLNEMLLLRNERMKELNSEIATKRIEMEEIVRKEVELKSDEFMKKSYNAIVKQVVDSTRMFFSNELSSSEKKEGFMESLVDGLSVKLSGSSEHSSVC